MIRLRYPRPALCALDATLRRGWQHDGRDPMNPAKPGPRPQKVPLA